MANFGLFLNAGAQLERALESIERFASEVMSLLSAGRAADAPAK